ncbi:extracellular solute-binding protein [Devosia marina]|uniref:Extracellular solute-binding protein n=1 Tax=Devosia marina TaxID=2683198 RepID=A0A7X3K2Z0_9HYPH|nr:extracellular solute-binding protein [Devosia marina]
MARSSRVQKPDRTGGLPEGPYEAQDPSAVRSASNVAMMQTIEFVDALRSTTSGHLGIDSRDLGIVLHLMRNHVSGRLTTMSSLAAASGLSYGTAFRAIEGLVADGFLVRRTRTATGRSFSLHPTSELLRRWQLFAGHTRRLIDQVSGDGAGVVRKPVADIASVIPPPTVLETKLALPRGLRLLVHADPTFMAMNTLKRQFEMILGVPIQSKALSIDRLHAEIVQNGQRPASAYDIIACDLPWFGDMVRHGRLRALDDLIVQSEMDTSDFLPDAMASARRRGHQYGIPVLSTAELLVYRTDLLEEAGLEPPRTTSDALAVASALHAPERGRFGIAWNGGRGTALGHTFMVTMAAHGQPIVNLSQAADGFLPEDMSDADLRPMFDSEAAHVAADYLQSLLAVSPPGILSMTWYDRARAYTSGHAALAYAHTLLVNLFERDPNSPAYGKTGYLPQPTGLTGRPISPLGGYALAIPSNIAPERIAPAWAALEALTSASAAKLFVTNGSLASPRFSVNRDPEVRAISPIIGIVDTIARQGVLRAWPRPPVPGISALITIAGEEIHDMLSGQKSRADALARAQSRAEAVMRGRDKQ